MSESRQLLVTDDDRDFRHALVEGLARRGYGLIEAADGDEALSIIKESAVDLVLVDMHMPGLNGLETLAALRQRQIVIPVVLMSAQLDEEIVARATELRIDSVLAKPFSLRQITEVIERLLLGSYPPGPI